MKGTDKFFAGIVLGAAAGVALALFLKSDKGKELVSEAKETAKELLQKGKDFMNDMETSTNETTS